jgi:hypothetical protein
MFDDDFRRAASRLRRDTFVELRAQAISCIDKSRLFS